MTPDDGSDVGPSALEEGLKDIMAEIINSSRQEIIFMTNPKDLEKFWYFQWDDSASIEWNLYDFSRCLESYKKRCREWEDYHHRGQSMVVERVRDQYLWSKLEAFTKKFNEECHGSL